MQICQNNRPIDIDFPKYGRNTSIAGLSEVLPQRWNIIRFNYCTRWHLAATIAGKVGLDSFQNECIVAVLDYVIF